MTYRRVDETDPPPGTGVVLSGIYPVGFQQSHVDTDDDLQVIQATKPLSSPASDSQQVEGLVLERVQPNPAKTRFA